MRPFRNNLLIRQILRCVKQKESYASFLNENESDRFNYLVAVEYKGRGELDYREEWMYDEKSFLAVLQEVRDSLPENAEEDDVEDEERLAAIAACIKNNEKYRQLFTPRAIKCIYDCAGHMIYSRYPKEWVEGPDHENKFEAIVQEVLYFIHDVNDLPKLHRALKDVDVETDVSWADVHHNRRMRWQFTEIYLESRLDAEPELTADDLYQKAVLFVASSGSDDLQAQACLLLVTLFPHLRDTLPTLGRTSFIFGIPPGQSRFGRPSNDSPPARGGFSLFGTPAGQSAFGIPRN
jgi:hypothetical protein